MNYSTKDFKVCDLIQLIFFWVDFELFVIIQVLILRKLCFLFLRKKKLIGYNLDPFILLGLLYLPIF